MSNTIRSLAKARERQQAKAGEIPVTLGTLVSCATAQPPNVSALGMLLGQRDIPIKQSFLIGKIAKAVFAEIESYQESHKTLAEKYANKGSDGKAIILNAEGKPIAEGEQGRYDIPKDKLPAFESEHQDLLATEVSIPGQKINVNELHGAKMAPAYLMAIEWMIAE